MNWQAWTLRLAPVAGALFVGAAIGLGPSTEVAESGVSDYADVVTEWMVEETADGEVLETTRGRGDGAALAGRRGNDG